MWSLLRSLCFTTKWGGLIFIDSVWCMFLEIRDFQFSSVLENSLNIAFCILYLPFWKLFQTYVGIILFSLLYVLTIRISCLFFLVHIISTDFSFSSLIHSSAVIIQLFNSPKAFGLISLYSPKFYSLLIQICLFCSQCLTLLKF